MADAGAAPRPGPMIHQVHARRWQRELSRRLGRPVTLSSIPDAELTGLARDGFTHFWLMGAWRTGPLAREAALRDPGLAAEFTKIKAGWDEDDVCGSPFAIEAYLPAPELGTAQELQVFREQLHRHGLRLMLDAVFNHVGLDHPWVRAHPGYFVASSAPADGFFPANGRYLAHGRDPYFPPWTDTVQLDLRHASTREALLGVARSLAAQCDAVRCDMAMLLLGDVFARTWERFPSRIEPAPGEFWEEAVQAARRVNPAMEFFAEAYWGLEDRLLGLGFDFAYDKTVLDRLLCDDWSGLRRHLLERPISRLASDVHFLENHDELRAASRFEGDALRTALTLILGLPGARLLQEGQVSGSRQRAPVQCAGPVPETADPDLASFHHDLFSWFLGIRREGARFAWVEEVPDPLLILEWKSSARAAWIVINGSAGRWDGPVRIEGLGSPVLCEGLSSPSARVFLGRGTLDIFLPARGRAVVTFAGGKLAKFFH